MVIIFVVLIYIYWIEEYDIIGSYFFYYIIGNCYLLRLKKKLMNGWFCLVIKNMGLISKEYFC